MATTRYSLILWNPLRSRPIISEASRVLQLLLIRVHDQVRLVILLAALDSIKRHGDILFTGSQETADSDHKSFDLARLVDEHVLDVANFVIGGIIDVLFIVVRDREGITWQGLEYFVVLLGSRHTGDKQNHCYSRDDSSHDVILWFGLQ